jgi:hypothetical protein
MPGSLVESGSEEPVEKTKPVIRTTTVLIAFGFLIALASSVLLAADRNVALLIPSEQLSAIQEPGWVGLGMLVSGLFLANMARMVQIWDRFKTASLILPAERNKIQRRVIRQGFRELFAYLYLSLISLTCVVFLSAQGVFFQPHGLGLDGLNPSTLRPANIGAALGCLFTSFIPLVSAFYLKARSEEAGIHKRTFFRDDAISVPSFWLSAAIGFGIVSLAIWAAKPDRFQSNELAVWITFGTTFAVMAMFLAFIFLPHLIRLIEMIADRELLSNGTSYAGYPILTGPAKLTSYVDSFLVRVVAPLTGATQNGPAIPHLFVVLSVVPLTALGFALAPPFGLVPIALGMMMVIALGRRWAWIEEDRETASRLLQTESTEINIGFDNDLKDEALLGYATFFILVPLSLYQIYGWQHDAFSAGAGNTGNAFVDWLSFFGSELAKAVPFVDWWEIYRVDLPEVFVPSDEHPLGKHLTFASRAIVDLVIMAALVQAIGIWQRSQTQKRLYAAGQVDAFDPFTEESFFKAGM